MYLFIYLSTMSIPLMYGKGRHLYIHICIDLSETKDKMLGRVSCFRSITGHGGKGRLPLHPLAFYSVWTF